MIKSYFFSSKFKADNYMYVITRAHNITFYADRWKLILMTICKLTFQICFDKMIVYVYHHEYN